MEPEQNPSKNIEASGDASARFLESAHSFALSEIINNGNNSTSVAVKIIESTYKQSGDATITPVTIEDAVHSTAKAQQLPENERIALQTKLLNLLDKSTQETVPSPSLGGVNTHVLDMMERGRVA